jgi:hypothetical protein
MPQEPRVNRVYRILFLLAALGLPLAQGGIAGARDRAVLWFQEDSICGQVRLATDVSGDFQLPVLVLVDSGTVLRYDIPCYILDKWEWVDQPTIEPIPPWETIEYGTVSYALTGMYDSLVSDTPDICGVRTEPPMIEFRVDRNTIHRGECTTLRWDVENVLAVYLDGEGVVGHDTRQICPQATTTYALHIVTHSGEEDRWITVTVLEPPTAEPPPTPTRRPPTPTRPSPTPTKPSPTPTKVPLQPTEPPESEHESPDAPSGSTFLCGQVKWGTVKTGGHFYPLLFLCESSMAYLIHGGSLQPNAYYRIYDPAIESIRPIPFHQYLEVGDQISSWSRIESIAGCQVCGQGPPDTTPHRGPTDLRLIEIDVQPREPKAFETFQLSLTIANSGFNRYDSNAGYQIEVEFQEDMLDESTMLLFDSEMPGAEQWLAPLRLPALEPRAGRTTVQVSGLRFPATYRGRVWVTFRPKVVDTNPGNNQLSQALDIGPSSQSYRHCVGLVLVAYNGALQKTMGATPSVTASRLEMVARVDSRCYPGGRLNDACVIHEMNQALESAFIDALAATPGLPVGVVAVLVAKDTIKVLLEAGKCIDWGWYLLRPLIDRSPESTESLTLASVQGPAHVMVVDASKRRVGFDSQGELVEEIPDTQVVRIGSEEVVAVTDLPELSLHLACPGETTTTLLLVHTDTEGNTTVANYEDLRVNNVTVARMQPVLLSLA